MKTLVSRFVKDESGATAIEYGLIAAGISVAIITVVQRPRQQAEHDLRQREERPELTSRSRSGSEKAPERSGAFSLCAIPSLRRYAKLLPIIASNPTDCAYILFKPFR